MPEPVSIVRGRPSNPGLDFETLRDRGLETVRTLSGAVWTDHNEHDPGITTLEILCYALTELSYRADLPIEVLLGTLSGGPDARTTALYRPRTILPSAPVTADDWRRLLIDRVPGCGNAWVAPAHAHGGPDGLWAITLDLSDPRAADAAFRAAAVRRARRVFTRYRPLGEDVVRVSVLRPAAATLAGRVTVAAGARPESVLARIYFAAGLFLAPEVRRQPLHRDGPADHSASDRLTGPLLLNGAIDDDDLRPARTTVQLDDLARVVRSVEGVSRVAHLELRTGEGRIGDQAAQGLAVRKGTRLRLDTRPIAGAFAVRLEVNGVEYRPQAEIVESELARLWAEHRRRYRDQPAAPVPAPPRGPGSALDAYHSIQLDFPAVYGINAHGLPADASPLRRAQARQFKGYLLIFEQLLADEFARLAGAPELFTTRAARTRVSQSLSASVPDAEPLLTPDYADRLPGIARMADRALERRNRVLDVMLATYGETLGASAPTAAPRRGSEDPLLQGQIRAKRALLRRLPRLSARRGCGLDYLSSDARHGEPSLAVKSRIQLGMDPEPRPLHALLSRARVRLIGSAPPRQRATMVRHANVIDETFEPVAHVPAPTGGRAHEWPISDDLLLAGALLDHYRIGRLPGSSAFTVVCRAPAQPVWQLVGHYAEIDAALATISELQATVRDLEPRLRRLVILEHALLRFGQPAARTPADLSTVTAVVALPAREASDAGVRASVWRVLQDNTPAHLILDVAFLRFSHLAAFDALYETWRGGLRRRGRPLVDACQRLREFLQSGGS
ncbi:MAG: hypothetical protein AB7I13_18395 [Vicinamibacterales bacterium]